MPTPDGNWHEWTVTFDKASGALLIYEDSILVKSGTASALSGASTNFVIGHSGSTYFDGSVDEVRVWNTPLAAAVIAGNWNRTFLGSQAGLVADWEFNEGQGSTASDGSGNGHDGTLEGSPQWVQTVISAPPAAPFSGFTLIFNGGADLTVPGLPIDVSVQGMATFTTDISNAALDLTLDGKADIQPIGIGIGLTGFVHFDLAKGTFIPELYGALLIKPEGLDQLQSIGLNIEDAYAFLRFNTTQDDHSTDLQLPTESKPTPVWIPAHSGSLVVNGTAGFEVAGTQIFQIHGGADRPTSTHAQGTNYFELDALLSASLILGPPASPVVTFMADGFLQFSSKGVAADFTLSRSTPTTTHGSSSRTSRIGGPRPPALADNKFKLELNTTKSDVSFTTPSLEDPTTHKPTAASTTTITVPAGPHNADGTVGAPDTYLLVDGSGHLNILNSFTLDGAFDLLATPSQFKFDVDADLKLKLQSTTLLDLTAKGGILIYDKGVAAGFNLALKAGLPAGYGFSLNAGFQLELNTTGHDQTFSLGDTGQTLTVPAGNGSYAVQVHATGDLMVGSFDLNGTFDFKADASGVTIVATSHTTLGPLGQATVLGTLVVVNPNNLVGQTGGLYALLQASYATSPTLPGLEADLHFELLVNTTNIGRAVSGSGGVQPFTVNPSHGGPHLRPVGHDPGDRGDGRGRRRPDGGEHDRPGRRVRPDRRRGRPERRGPRDADGLPRVQPGGQRHDRASTTTTPPSGRAASSPTSASPSAAAGARHPLRSRPTPELVVNTSPVARNGTAANTYEVEASTMRRSASSA